MDSSANKKKNALIKDDEWENLKFIFFNEEINERFIDNSFQNNLNSIFNMNNTRTSIIQNVKSKIEELKYSNSKDNQKIKIKTIISNNLLN